MTRGKVSWKSDGLKICGELFVPSGSRSRYPSVIVCHGIPAGGKSADDPGYPSLAEHFCRGGFLVLIFNFRGAGESEGNFDLCGWVRDLEGALDFLSGNGATDPQRIYLVGFSAGAAVSIYVAAHHPNVSGVISCASPAEFLDLTRDDTLQEFLDRARTTGIIRDPDFPASLPEWRRSFLTIRPECWADRIPPRPFLILHGDQDDIVPVQHSLRIHGNTRGQAELAIIKGGGHRLRLDRQAMEKALDFLKKNAFP